MAKLIRAIPELKGSEAAEFLAKMLKRERLPISRKDIELANAIEKFSNGH